MLTKFETELHSKLKLDTILTTEAIKILGITERRIIKDKNCENVPQLESTEVVLVYYNIVNNQWQYYSRVLCAFLPNKFSKLIPNIHFVSY